MTAAASAQITVSVVVVSLGAREKLIDCLQQLRECNMLESSPGAASEVVVVDVSEGEGDTEAVAQSFPCVTLLHEAPDSGFAHACNTGIAAARGARILLLDPCTHIPGRFLSDLLAHLDGNTSVAAVGPCLRRFASDFPSTVAIVPVDEYAGVEAPSVMTPGPTDPQTAAVHETVDWLPATCLLLDRRALNDVGPFYEGTLFTFEETDWCRRARERGWDIHRLPTVAVDLDDETGLPPGDRTAVEASLRDDPFSQSRRHHFRKHHGRTAVMAVGAVSGAKRLVKTARAAIGLNR